MNEPLAEKPFISVIVCTYNRRDFLGQALESLLELETEGAFSYEIVIVDDASTDGTRTTVEEFRDRAAVPVKYVRAEGRGIAPARTRGVREASGEWIAFFDDDQIADPSWLKELLGLAHEKDTLCVGGPRFLKLPQDRLAALSPVCRGILGEVDHGPEPKKCGRKSLPNTGNALTHRKVFEAVGYFDESRAWGGEDPEFFWRAVQAGFEAWYTPRAVVYHLIEPYRLSEEYFLWSSLRVGKSFAQRDHKQLGAGKTILLAIGRIGQAVLVNGPLFLYAFLRGDQAEKLGRKCLLWRMAGYVRHTLYIISPVLFRQKKFFERLEFRRKRATFRKG